MLVILCPIHAFRLAKVEAGELTLESALRTLDPKLKSTVWRTISTRVKDGEITAAEAINIVVILICLAWA